MKKIAIAFMLMCSINAFAVTCNTTTISGIQQCAEAKYWEQYAETAAAVAIVVFFDVFKQ